MVDVFPDTNAERWLKHYAVRNFWRVAPWLELDDIMQLGYEAYYETRSRYPTATEPKHIQSLFQLVFRSRLEDVVRCYVKQVDEPDSEKVEESEASFDATGLPWTKSSGLLDIHALLIKAPEKVTKVVDLLVKEPGVLSKPYEKDDSGRRETLNDRLCVLLGLDPKSVDLVKMTRNYFQGVRHAA